MLPHRIPRPEKPQNKIKKDMQTSMFLNEIEIDTVKRVLIIGAGPSANNKMLRQEFHQYDVTIGVNWVCKQFPVRYNVTTHFGVLKELDEENDTHSTQVYSTLTSDVQYQARNYKPKNVHSIPFMPFSDLQCGYSTIIPAIHLGMMINPECITLVGVELALDSSGRMYSDGYIQNDRNKPSDRHFNDWAKVVRLQIAGLTKLTDCTLLTY